MKRLLVSLPIAGLIVFSIIPVSATVLEDPGGVELEEDEKKPSSDETNNSIEAPIFEPDNDASVDTDNDDAGTEPGVDTNKPSDDLPDRDTSESTESIPNDEGIANPEGFLGAVTLTAIDGDNSGDVSVCMFGEQTSYSLDGENWMSVGDESTVYLDNKEASTITISNGTDTVVCDLTE